MGVGDFEGVLYAVGGHIQVMNVGRGFITSQIVHRWPDAVGKVIDPAAGEAIPE